MTSSHWLRRMGFGVLLVVGVALVVAPNLVADLPDRDSGLFLYMGSRILDGEIPYRDVWDHKGPLIYYINALGVLISQGSEVGIWLLEVAAIFAAALGIYILTRRTFGGLPAIFSTILFLGSLGFVLHPGNYTEEFTLPFQVAALLLFARSGGAEGGGRAWFLIGVTFAATLLLRPNNAGIHIAILAYGAGDRVLSGRLGEAVRTAGLFLLGTAIMVLPVLLYFVWNGALPDFWDAVVRFNAAYVSAPMRARIEAVLEGFWLLAPTGVLLFAVSAWLMALLRAAWRRGQGVSENHLIHVAVLALPIEFLFLAVSGRSLNHYYITWLAVCAVLAGEFFRAFLNSPVEGKSDATTNLSRRAWAVGLIVAVLILPMRRLIPPFFQLLISGPRQASTIGADLARYEEEFVLMWGAEPAFNYFSGKISPTRFVYQYPLYTCGYVRDDMATAFRQEVVIHRPIIVDSSTTNGRVPPVDPRRRADWETETRNCALTQPMRELLAFVDRNYELVGHMSPTGWPIYRYVE